MSHPRHLARATVSLVGLAALLVGVPALLIGLVGWPLPHGVPSVDEVRSALGDGWHPGERFVMGFLALVLWLMWAQVVRHVLAQLRFQLRLRAAAAATGDARLPQVAFGSARRRGPLQQVVGWLVGGVMMVTPLVPAAARAQPAPRIPAVLDVTRALVEPVGEPQLSAPATSATDLDAPSYVVHTWAERRDCLWNIADRYLGDPFRWTEIRDLNRDRLQPDGRRLGDDPSSWVYPGWVLLLPPDATGLDVVPAHAVQPAPAPAASPAAASGPEPLPPASPLPSAAPPTVASPPTTVLQTGPGPATSAPSAAPLAGAPLPAPSGPPRPGGPAASAPTSTTSRTVPVPVPVAANGAPITAVRSAASSTTAAPAADATPPAATRHLRRGGWSLTRDFPVRIDGAGLLGAGLLAAGVVGTLDRMRRRQRRRGRLLLPDVGLAGKELALREGADPKGAAFVDAALRVMAAALGESGEAVPDVLAVELGRAEMAVILDSPSPHAPAGFTAGDGGRRWVISRSRAIDELEELAEGVPAPCPALVSVGRTRGGATLLVDLEQSALTSVVGDEERRRGLLAALAVELATSQWADFVSLVLVGFGAELAGLERVRVVGSVAEVIAELERTAGDVAAALENAGCASTLEARVRGDAPDAWVPTIVVCAAPPPVRLARRLAAVASEAGNAGVAVLVGGAVDGAWELAVAGEEVDVGPLATRVVGHGVSPDEAEAVGELFQIGLEVAGDDEDEDDGEGEGAPPTSVAKRGRSDDDRHGEQGEGSAGSAGRTGEATWAAPAGAGLRLGGGGDDDDGSTVLPPGLPPELAELEIVRGHDVLLGIMGPVGLWGGAKPLTRAKSMELVAYLALHPRKPIDAERLMDVLSPEWRYKKAPAGKRHPAAVTLNTTVSVARGGLGDAPDGRPHVPHLQGNGTRYYGLHRVGLDYQLFCIELQKAHGAKLGGDADAEMAALRSGLCLVRGVPFEGIAKEDDETKPYQWVFVEGIFYRVEAEIREAAHRLAELCLAAGDPQGAAEAARQGRLACPSDVTLAQDLMVAGGEARDPAAVEDAMREHRELLEADEPYDRVDAETVELYRQQLARALRRDSAEDRPTSPNGAPHHRVAHPTLVKR